MFSGRSMEALGLGEPTLSATVAAERADGRQPGGRPLGFYAGAPPRTQLLQLPITPRVNALGAVQTPTLIVPVTPPNRFITLVAPWIAFAVLINPEASMNPLSNIVLPPGLPFEIPLPGNQALYAVTTSPVFVQLQIQIAPAIASDTERRLGP